MTMTIEIEKKTDTHYVVNDKNIHQNMDGEWVCSEELTPTEMKVFFKTIKIVQNE